ncbi:hypothetical protein TNCV_4903851 [Trichonephila clavipes]|nr:hypothetical protein TNCV_4903851 [Trichonephila clavipes]
MNAESGGICEGIIVSHYSTTQELLGTDLAALNLCLDSNDTNVETSSPNYHNNGRTFELSAELTCIGPLHGASSEVLDSN